MAATASPTEKILQRFESLEKRLSPVEGLLKSLAEPASRAGVTPVELIQRMTQDGRSATFGDGAFTQAATVHAARRMKGMGNVRDDAALWDRFGNGEPPKDYKPSGKSFSFREFIHLLYLKEKHGNNAPAECKQLFEPRDKGGFGMAVEKTALAEASGLAGGYTIPPMFAASLLTMAPEDAIVSPRASHLPMTALTLQVPSLDLTTVQGSGNSPFFGGIIPAWVAEAATRTETEPQFRQTELKAHEASFYTVASNTLLADSAIALEALLTQLFTLAIRWFVDYAFLQGNGVGKPVGVINAAAALQVTRAGGAATQTLAWADVVTMWSKLYGVASWSNPGTCWVAHQSLFPKIAQLVDNAGRPLFQPLDMGIQQKLTGTNGVYSAGSLLGAMLYFSEKLPSIGNTGDLILCDFSKYLIGDRADLQIDVSPHVKFLTNQMVWRVIWRGDGQPWLNNSITLADGTFTVSPFVVLK